MENLGIMNILSALSNSNVKKPTKTETSATSPLENKSVETKESATKEVKSSSVMTPPPLLITNKNMLEIIQKHNIISKRIDEIK